jgi:hypothetical protein
MQSRYGLTPPEQDISELTQQYTAALPGKRATGMSAAYEELLGRQATAEELSKGQERFQQGYYGSMEDFKGSLTKSQEYQKKFNQSYLDNYYDTMYGKQAVDEKGDKTGERTFKFDSKLLPSYGGNLADRTKITTPDFGEGFKVLQQSWKHNNKMYVIPGSICTVLVLPTSKVKLIKKLSPSRMKEPSK